MKKSVIVILAITLGHEAVAQECRELENDLDRLACYDLESGRTAVSEIVVSPTSEWRVRAETSDMTDQTDVFLSVESENYVSCGFGGPSKPVLFVRCVENTTAVVIATACHLADLQSYGQVTYRLDDLPASSKGFEESTNNRALGLWNGGSAIPFVKNMLGHDTLLTRFTPFGENAISPRFNIAGLDEEIGPSREACGW